MPWEEDGFSDSDRRRCQIVDVATLDGLERRFWLDLWRAPVLDAVDEQGIEARRYGSVQATLTAGLPRTPMFNLVLGACEPGAVELGHLEEALAWAESLEVDFRVPIAAGRAESAAAEDLLNQRGYRRHEGLARFARLAAPPALPEPAGIEVIELEGFTEGFSDFPGEGFDLDLTAWSFFDCLPQRDHWRCYVALDRRGYPVAGGLMMMHYGVAQLAFAGTGDAARGQGCHLALLRRRIHDAYEAGCRAVFTEIEEPLDRIDPPGVAARNLARAGFERLEVRPVWRPPLPPQDEADGEDESDGEDELDWEDDGPA